MAERRRAAAMPRQPMPLALCRGQSRDVNHLLPSATPRQRGGDGDNQSVDRSLAYRRSADALSGAMAHGACLPWRIWSPSAPARR